jgi:hypothetical protein
MTLDLNVMSSPSLAKQLSLTLLAVEARIRSTADESGWISSEDLSEIIKEEVEKTSQEADVETRIGVILDLIMVKNMAVQEFGKGVHTCLNEHQMPIKDVVFAAIFAGANLNVSAELKATDPIKETYSKQQFMQIAELAYDYMLLHQKSLMKATGQHPPHDN